MATSPTTSALGALGDLGRQAAAKTTARTGDTAEKPRFSDVLEGAQGSRPEPQPHPAAEQTAAPKTRTDDEKVVVTRTRTAALGGNKPAAPAATATSTGKDLPPAGETLPVTLDQLLTDGVIGTEARESSGKDDSAGTDAATESQLDPLAPTPGMPLVVPENSVMAAAAALASRTGQLSGDDGHPSTAVGDVTSTQKREIPAAPQTLNAATTLPGDPMSATTTLGETTDVQLALADMATNKKLPADKQSAEILPPDQMPAAALPGSTAAGAIVPGANPVGEKAVADMSGQGLTLEKMTGAKTAGDGLVGEKKSAALAVGDGAAPDAMLADSGISGIPEQSAETERGTFRDTLKQLDSTLAPSAPRSDTGPVTATRDSGLRQYLDSSATAAKVDVPVGKPGWSDAVAGKVMWMSSQNLSSAEIQMNPADLGPLSVRVSSHQDQTSIYFTSPHASVREALDQSLSRLREMMGNQGIQLQDVGVGGQGSMREQHAFSDGGSGGGSRGRGARDAEIDTEIGSVARTTTTVSRPGLLDAYA
ncbi:MAG: flagellar hook-length control protein FliK [Spongiibacteraceae bacterium]